MTPQISIPLPNFNHAHFLGECIRSIQAQSFANWELVIVDDGSTDDSWNTIQKFAQDDRRIRADRFQSNHGILVALDRAFELCRGELIHPRASDNPLVSELFFEHAISAFNQRPEIATVFALTTGIDHAGTVVAQWGAPSERRNFVSPEQATKEFFYSDYISGESIIFKKSLFLRHGGYDRHLGPLIDLFLNEGLTAIYGGVFLDEVASRTRLDADSFSRRQTSIAMIQQAALMERKFLALPLPVSPPEEWVRAYRERKLTEILLFRERNSLSAALHQLSKQLSAWPKNRTPSVVALAVAQLQNLGDAVRSECVLDVNHALALYNAIVGSIER